MKCPGCEVSNPEGARYCAQCGTRLADPLRNRAALPRARPRARLAGSLPASPDALAAERKQVTVLFADMQGSMELLAGRDPEEARKILDPVLELMMEAVHRFEGTVNHVMGDGIMALFGAPLAHEDHAVRACYAALGMQEAVRRFADAARREQRIDIQIRVGLNSGEVVVRTIANDLKLDYTAVGQTTHLAARMEQLARPDTILITAETRRLAEGYIDVDPLGPVAVKGLAEPLLTFRLVGARPARTRLQARSAHHLTRIVGREAELEQLRRALDATAAGRGQVVAVVGEPGTGKSRLIHEIADSQRTRDWLVLEASAFPYNRSTAYLPFIDVISAHARVERSDDIQRAGDKIRKTVLELDEQLRPAIPALLALLGIPIDDPGWNALAASVRRRRTIDAIASMLIHESRRQPVCLVIEDLHWIDSETQAVLDDLVQRLPAARVLLLVSYRPEYRHGWAGRTYCSAMWVNALPPERAEELLRDLLGSDAALPPFKQRLVERTGGNPFFLEECVRAAVETGVLAGEPGAYSLARAVEDIRVPATVHAVLAARIDRLAPQDKMLLGTAAVIGRNVPFALLRAVADATEESLHGSLAHLRDAELLYETRPFPDREYTFRHALIHEVAYGNLLHEQRREMHARIVEAIEKLAGDRLPDYVERLAHHARGGELWESATRYLRQAGAKAFAHSANHEAVALFEQALEAIERLPETSATLAETVDLHFALRNSLTLLGEHDRTLAHLREAKTLAERIADRYRLGRALSFEANCFVLLGQHEAAIDSGRRARAVADELNDVPLRIAIDQYVGRAHLHLGNFPRAIETFEGIVTMLPGALSLDRCGLTVLPSVFARSHLVECLAEVGRFPESARYAAEALELAETTNHPDTLLWAHHGSGMHHLARREGRAASEALGRAHTLCRTHDMPAYGPRISAELGLAWALSGRAAEAVPLVKRAVEEISARPRTTSYSAVLLLLGEVCLIAGRLDEAAHSATSALDLFRRQSQRANEADTLRLLGDIAARQNPSDLIPAQARFQEAATLAKDLGMRPLAARCELRLGQLARNSVRPQDAVPALRAARDQFRAMELRADLAESEAALNGLT